MAKAANGGNTGAKVLFRSRRTATKAAVTITIGEKTWTHDVAEHLGRDTPLEESPFVMRVEALLAGFPHR